MLVRSFDIETDLSKVLDLYRAPGAPFFIRDEDFFLHFMTFPGVHTDGIFVCEDGATLTGVAIVAISDAEGELRKGEMIELFCRDARSMEMLLEKSYSYACERGVDYITAKPAIVEGTDEVFRDWVRIDTGVTMIKLVALLPLVKALANSSELLKREDSNKHVVIIADKEVVQIRIADGNISVEGLSEIPPGVYCTIRTTAATFLEIVTGMTHPFVAYLRRRLSISGLKVVPFAIKLLTGFRMSRPYIAIVDML